MDISECLKSLPNLSKTGLCDVWQELLGEPAPAYIRKELLLRILAYRIQEQAFGGLNPATERRLRQLARMFEKDPNATLPNVRPAKPGTRLIRQWQGRTYKVTVREEDFEYEGKRYRSLSEIARLITGTRWSGPLFFGLRSAGAQENTR